MNAKQWKKQLARRACVCDSLEHCCETIRDFEIRTGIKLIDKLRIAALHKVTEAKRR